MKIHDLKIWPEFFDAVDSGIKTFDLRKDDRDFRVGDILKLREWVPAGHFYTGKSVVKQISYILEHHPNRGCAATFGLREGYVILAFEPVIGGLR